MFRIGQPQVADAAVGSKRTLVATETSDLWWPLSNKSRELNEALQGEREFRQWLKENMDKTDLQAIDGKAQAKQIIDSLDSQTYEKLVELVEPYYAIQSLAQTERAKSSLRIKRTKGVRKVTTGFMRFAQTFQEFLKVYSGIVDIMNLASDQYGGAAYGALSMLFSVAAAKQGMETALQAAIEDLKIRLEEMAIYKTAYPDPSLGAFIAKVYKGITDFSRHATKYYKAHRIYRFGKAAGNPHTFDNEVAKIKKLIGDVQSRCEALLAERCDRLEKQSNELLNRNQTLHCELIHVQEQNKELLKKMDILSHTANRGEEQRCSQSVRDLLKQLGAPNFNEDEHRKEADSCKIHLQQFAEDRLRTQLDLDTLQATPQYSTWYSSDKSCLLALSGRNEQNVIEQSGRCSWLSPAVLDLLKQLGERNRFVIYHLCLLHPSQHENKDPTAHEIVISFISQIFTKCPKILSEESAFARLHSRAQRLSKPDNIDDLCDFLLSILQLLDPKLGPIYIILDRIDACSGETSQGELTKALLRVVQKVPSTCKVKVLIATCATFWDLMKTHKLEPGTFIPLVRDQKVFDSY